MEINNPYLEEKRKLITALSKLSSKDLRYDSANKILNEIIEKEREWLNATLGELFSKVEICSEKINEVKNDSQRKTVKAMQTYKDSCKLYKECYSLLLEIREIKKQVRNEIYYKR